MSTVSEPEPPPPIDGAVICEETEGDRKEHAAALAETPDTRALRTGVVLLKKLDAGCKGGPQ